MIRRASAGVFAIATLYTISWANPAGVPVPGVPLDRFPVEAYGNHLFVKVRVNGSAPLDFVLDTGASDCGIDRRRADELHIPLEPLEGQTGIGTGEGEPGIAMARNVTLGIGGVELSDRVVYAVPFGELSAAAGRRIDGVIGADLFREYAVRIDYAARAVELFDAAKYRYSGKGAILRLTFSDGRPLVAASVEFAGRRILAGRFIVDTGDGSAIGLHTPFVRKHRLPPDGQPVLREITRGIAGTAPEVRSRARRFRLGPFALRDPVVAFAQAEKGSTADPSYEGSIGGEVLRRFTVTFDYRHRRMILERTSSFDDPFDVDASGLDLGATGPELSTIVVARVSDGSPASSAGVLAGDRLVAVDGVPASQLDVARLQEMFMKEAVTYRLTIERDAQPIEVSLTTKKRL